MPSDMAWTSNWGGLDHLVPSTHSLLLGYAGQTLKHVAVLFAVDSQPRSSGF